MKINSILLGSENPTALVEYYSKLFGEGWSDESYTGWKIGDSVLSVGPHSQVKGMNEAPGRILWNIECEDVQAEADRMIAAGATVVQEPYHPGDVESMTIATFSDPDGNYFQLMSPMPEEWA